ncbi:hypothetical protein L1887_56959 [Cichorium endivia]|nr:hypothetical protein L1887_56959 [Cichorium endivia]
MRLPSLAEGAKSSSVLGRLHASHSFFAWISLARTRTYRSHLAPLYARETPRCALVSCTSSGPVLPQTEFLCWSPLARRSGHSTLLFRLGSMKTSASSHACDWKRPSKLRTQPCGITGRSVQLTLVWLRIQPLHKLRLSSIRTTRSVRLADVCCIAAADACRRRLAASSPLCASKAPRARRPPSAFPKLSLPLSHDHSVQRRDRADTGPWQNACSVIALGQTINSH